MFSAKALWSLVAIETLALLICIVVTNRRPDELHTAGYSNCRAVTVALRPNFTDTGTTLNRSQPAPTPSWYGDVGHSVNEARSLLGSAGSAATADRILVPLLSSRSDELCCFLRLFGRNVAPVTPADIFIFSVDNSAEAIVTAACPSEGSGQHVHFMALREHWMTPWEAGPKASWAGIKSEDYRRMGHWRLLFPMAFAAELGYSLVWQLDDDSFFTKPLRTNMLQFARERRLLMGAQRVAPDSPDVNWGLPELARSFLVSEQRAPAGPLYKHCRPASLAGVRSTTQLPPLRRNKKIQSSGGWDRQTPQGNCVLINVTFYQLPLVQKWVRTVVSSGGHFRFRWQEQATMAMMRDIFVPDKRFSMLGVAGYQHRPSRPACSNG